MHLIIEEKDFLFRFKICISWVRNLTRSLASAAMEAQSLSPEWEGSGLSSEAGRQAPGAV